MYTFNLNEAFSSYLSKGVLQSFTESGPKKGYIGLGLGSRLHAPFFNAAPVPIKSNQRMN